MFFQKQLKSNVFIIRIYHGYEKPYCSNDFLKDFILEINLFITNGYKANDSNIVVNIQLAEIICDAPAKSFVLKTKGQNGFYSCSRCNQKGKTLNGRKFLPETNSQIRTPDNFVNQEQKEHHLGTSDLVNVPRFDLVRCVPLDYICISFV